jgi:hypothetical protein
MRTLKFLTLPLFAAVVAGCSSVYNVHTSDVGVDTAQTIVIVPFENHTQTPDAGKQASKIVEGVARSEGYKVEYAAVKIDHNDALTLEKSLLPADARYLLVGEVNEWRYKTGIDGEPAVSMMLKLYDLQSDEVIWSAVGAKSGWGFDSVGVIAQDVAEELVETARD